MNFKASLSVFPTENSIHITIELATLCLFSHFILRDRLFS